MVNPRVPFRLATKRSALPPPGAKPLIVQIVVAVEIFDFDQAIPCRILWVEYGLRCGVPRLARVLRERGIYPQSPASTRM